MNATEYNHELIIPNEIIPVKIFSFSAHNDLRIIPFHWHGAAEILYVKRGRLNIWMKDKKYELKANDFIYINSKEVHSTQSPEDNEVIVLQIPGDLLETFSNKEYLKIHCNTIDFMNNKGFDSIRELIYQIYLYSEKKDEGYYLKVYSLLFDLGYILVKHFRVKTHDIDIHSQKYLDRLSEICSFIKKNYQLDLTLNSVAEEFGYSPQYLSRMFQKYTGSTFLTYLNSIRLNYAFQWVVNTDHSMLNIAEENGFANVKSFNKIFKDTYGMTPTAYRRYMKKQ